MSSSTPSRQKPAFLLDENVRVELDGFLASRGFDIKRLAPATGDSEIAAVSKKEKRVLVTNDRGFTQLVKGRMFSVVWLRIPMRDLAALLASFHKLLVECIKFAGRLIILYPNEWKEFPLPRRVAYRLSRRTK